jgi:hypothetical protein
MCSTPSLPSFVVCFCPPPEVEGDKSLTYQESLILTGVSKQSSCINLPNQVVAAVPISKNL